MLFLLGIVPPFSGVVASLRTSGVLQHATMLFLGIAGKTFISMDTAKAMAIWKPTLQALLEF